MVLSFEFSIIFQLFQTTSGVSLKCSEIMRHIFTEWLLLHLQLKDFNKFSMYLGFLSVHQVKNVWPQFVFYILKGLRVVFSE